MSYGRANPFAGLAHFARFPDSGKEQIGFDRQAKGH